MNVPIAETYLVDLAPYERYVPEQYRAFFTAQPGVAPYRLLAFFSTLFNNQTIVEVGVHNGWGSLSLSYNTSNRVAGYDIDLSTLSPEIRDKDPTRLMFQQGLAHEEPGIVLSAPLIHFDAQHDGIYEQVFYDWLVAQQYKGWLLLDDIHQNEEMETFWGGIPLLRFDLSGYGHSTGTGLVCFGEPPIFI